VGELTEAHEPNQVADLRGLPPTPVNDTILRAGYRARLLVPLVRSGRHRTRGLVGGGSDDGDQALYPRAVLDDSRRQRAIRPCPNRGSLRRTAAPSG